MIRLASGPKVWHRGGVRRSLLLLLAGAGIAAASTITVVPIYEPLSLHGTDADGEELSDVGETLRATVLSRPMALSGAFPEILIDSIRSPHKIPANNPNYKAAEANLLVLCQIGLEAELTEEQQLLVRIDVRDIKIPEEVDLTSRQILRLAIIAIRKTLEEFQKPQTEPLEVTVVIVGTEEATDSLRDLSARFTLGA